MQLFLRSCSLLVLAHLCLAVHAAHAAAPYVGRPLKDVIDELRAEGAPLAYSSRLLPRTLTVEHEPHATAPLEIARELLAEHGLALRETAGVWLVVRGAVPAQAAPGAVALRVRTAATRAPLASGRVQADPPSGPVAPIEAGKTRLAGLSPGPHVLEIEADGYLPERVTVDVAAGQTVSVSVALAQATPQLEELTVTASRYDVRNEVQPSASYFTRDQIESLGELGADTLRTVHRLPGVATNEFSSRSHVRGGAVDEMAVLFDGVRLVEPYHLRDYEAVFSAIDQRLVGGLDVYSGGFPVAYGDALSGITLIEPREPMAPEHELGVSLLYSSLLMSGSVDSGDVRWLISARRGNIDRLLEPQLGKPSYRDGFAHVAITLGAKHDLSWSDIGLDDDITVTPESGSNHEVGVSDASTNQWWLKLDSRWSDALSSRTLLYSTSFSSERTGIVDDSGSLEGSASDARALDGLGLRQDWTWRVSQRQLLTFGAEAERLDAHYDYASTVASFGVLATLGADAAPRAYRLTARGSVYGAYLADRVRLTDRLVADLGFRLDRHTYLPAGTAEPVAPRASLLYRLGAETDLRLSVGRFLQAERPLDLPIEDGVTVFAPPQDATHSIIGVEHRFVRDLAVRVEAFRKQTRDVKPYYENLFDPLVLLPELRPGRVRIAPDRSDARGVEVLVTGERPVAWWLSYSLARADDLIDGERVPRSWDQRHAASGGVTLNVGPWSLSSTLTYHTGWPATALAIEAGAQGPVAAVDGTRNGMRLGAVRRLDFHASRSFAIRAGALKYTAELMNVTDRENPCCLGYDVVAAPGGATLAPFVHESVPLTLNTGILWQF